MEFLSRITEHRWKARSRAGSIYTALRDLSSESRQKLGVAFGPDLAAVQNRNKTALLVDILQPNKSIADGFELWSISLGPGENLSGIISQQTAQTLTITDATGKETTVVRDDIKELTASEWSAMPENLHAQINQEEMANLLAFLKSN